MAFKVEVWSDYALFTRPEMKTERCSYDVMTASAARGLLESIYWHPGIRWVIDKLYVLKDIKFTSVMRNEVSEKLSLRLAEQKVKNPESKLHLITSEKIQQRSSLLLRDVRYVIEAHFELTKNIRENDNEGKFAAIISRRLDKGQCYSQPYMGCREFPANFSAWKGDEIVTIQESRDLGYMLLDMNYNDPTDIKPIFHRAKMINGVITYPDPIKWIELRGGEIIHGSTE